VRIALGAITPRANVYGLGDAASCYDADANPVPCTASNAIYCAGTGCDPNVAWASAPTLPGSANIGPTATPQTVNCPGTAPFYVNGLCVSASQLTTVEGGAAGVTTGVTPIVLIAGVIVLAVFLFAAVGAK